MPRRSLSQSSFFDPEFVMPGCLEPGTVPWLLARYRSRLFPDWLFRGWRGEGRRGRNAWPAVSLMTLLFLRWSEDGISRLGSAKRAQADVRWRAAMGVHLRAPTPNEKTLREFEAFLREPHPAAGASRYLLLHEHIVRLCFDAEVVTSPLWTMDSTPMWCYGAVRDTVRLLGDGTRTLARRWAEASKQSIEDVAAAWEVPYVLGKSTKGALGIIDWRNADARASALDTLARGALRCAQFVRTHLHSVGRSKRKRLLRDCRILLRVVRDDLETDKAGRLVVAKRVAKGRIISFTDPQARHGRKSKSSTFNGFKLHLPGDLVSGLITALTVTLGNAHDNTVAHRLIRRAKRLCEDLDQVLADTAYGSAELRYHVREQSHVYLLSPPPPHQANAFGRESIRVDFDAQTATCAAGVTTDVHQRVWSKDYERDVSAFRWPKQICNACQSRQPCCRARQGGKYVRLHPFEQELRQARQDWQRPEIRDAYRTRSQCERLVNQMTRHGARRARGWGLQAAHFQAHAIAMACNLRLLARALARRSD